MRCILFIQNLLIKSYTGLTYGLNIVPIYLSQAKVLLGYIPIPSYSLSLEASLEARRSHFSSIVMTVWWHARREDMT
jgi:hypothetical protein